ncbi:MAG: RidA family protein [Pseudomonadota bacterium]
MAKQVLAVHPTVPLSGAVIANGFAFISGQVPINDDGSIPEGVGAQTTLVLEKIAALADAAGGSMADVVKTTVFLVEIGDFAEMNAAYAAAFPSEPPARSTIRCDLAVPVAVEIEAVVALPA